MSSSDLAERSKRYRAEGYWAGIPLGDSFRASVERNADRIAVVEGARRLTYAELGALVSGAAARLAELGIRSGERVLIQLPNSLELVVGYFACLEVGALPVACQPAHREREIEAIGRIAEAAAWFVPDQMRGFDYTTMIARVRAAVPSLREIFVRGKPPTPQERAFDELMECRVRPPTSIVRASDVAVLQLSGGSTGVPKIVPRTHDDYHCVSVLSAKAMDVDRETVFLAALPLTHNFSLATPGIQAVLLCGGRVVLTPTPSPAAVFPLIEAERVTWIPAVPATLIGWMNDPGWARTDLSSIRSVFVGGQRLWNEPATRALETLGSRLHQIYGMAEGLICCTRPGDSTDIIVGTQGRPICPADELRVVDELGTPVPEGMVGELETRGPYTITAYYAAGDYAADSFTADGFYRTGDLVRMHPSGNVLVEGRRKDIVNRGGEKIAADELEGLILSHPQVANTAVVAMPDAVLGERVCAFVSLRSEAPLTLEELRRFLQEEKCVSPAKLPERLVIRESLPLTPVGKVSKAELRIEARRF